MPEGRRREARGAEALRAERWRQGNAQLGRIEAVLAAIVLLRLLGEGSVVEVLRRLLGG